VSRRGEELTRGMVRPPLPPLPAFPPFCCQRWHLGPDGRGQHQIGGDGRYHEPESTTSSIS